MLKKSTKKKIKKGAQKAKRTVNKYATKIGLRRTNPNEYISVEYNVKLTANDDLLFVFTNLYSGEEIRRTIRLDPDDSWFLPILLRIFRMSSFEELIENQTHLSDRIYDILPSEWQRIKKLPITYTDSNIELRKNPKCRNFR